MKQVGAERDGAAGVMGQDDGFWQAPLSQETDEYSALHGQRDVLVFKLLR